MLDSAIAGNSVNTTQLRRSVVHYHNNMMSNNQYVRVIMCRRRGRRGSPGNRMRMIAFGKRQRIDLDKRI